MLRGAETGDRKHGITQAACLEAEKAYLGEVWKMFGEDWAHLPSKTSAALSMTFRMIARSAALCYHLLLRRHRYWPYKLFKNMGDTCDQPNLPRSLGRVDRSTCRPVRSRSGEVGRPGVRNATARDCSHDTHRHGAHREAPRFCMPASYDTSPRARHGVAGSGSMARHSQCGLRVQRPTSASRPAWSCSCARNDIEWTFIGALSRI